jgi:CRISPR/Cas system CMR subunit Cmr4 (Cas7 group RAMP superfamily)
MKDLSDNIKSLAAVISIAFALFFFLENRYLLSWKFEEFERVVQNELKNNQVQKINERVWQLQDRMKVKPNDETIIEELRNLEVKKKQLNKEIEELGKGKK